MRVLGIDPGSRNTGLGVVECHQGSLSCVEYSCIRMGREALPLRLGTIYRNVQQMVNQCHPDVVAVEQLFISKNLLRAALTLGQARGSAICAVVNAHCPVFEYSALQIKQAVVGFGGAKKDQVQHMVKVLLRLRKLPKSDEADALACAICHIHISQVESRRNH